ncbi:YhgE/Pip domain-containing protein [Metabacillus halosaccharovorans]|uniref:YhgE/Pip domain-containing protein n=1 Tax=Metabacillus halosaccharovorans TaxID=930124 RepID=UPI0037360549
MIKREFRAIFSKKMLIISLIGVMILPIIYSAAFLSSMWDPYGKIKELPIALVNEDQKAEFNGEYFDIGEEVIKELKNNNSFEWHFVSKEKAHKGVENGDYYAAITIPNDFSQNASSFLSSDPQKMSLNVESNPGYSYSGQSIANLSASTLVANHS